MKIRKSAKSAKRASAMERDLIIRQEAVLAATISDKRHNAWALEMLRRRNAAARWRGQLGCSVREVIRALDALPA